MNYQHLIYFLKAAEYQHYTHAAEELHITQPALTKAIIGIEEELGAPLFDKCGRNITLTKYGRIFLDYAKRSIGEIDNGISAVKYQMDNDMNSIDLFALCSISTTFLHQKSAEFHLAYPKCCLNITFKYTTAIINEMSKTAGPLGICGEFDNEVTYSSLVKTHLYSEPIKFIANKNHPIVSKKSSSVSELMDEQFAVYNVSNNGTNKLLFQICECSGFKPKSLVAAYNDYGLINEVISNNCIAIVSSYFFNQFKHLGLAEFQIDTPVPLIHNIYLIRHKDMKPTALTKKFYEILLDDYV